MIQWGIFRDDVLGQKVLQEDSQPSVNSKLHQSPTGPVTSLQLEECKFHCGIHAEEMRCVFCVNVCIFALRGGEDERSPSLQGAHLDRRGGLNHLQHPSTPSTCWWREPLALIRQLHYPLRQRRTLNHSISPGEEGEGRRRRGGRKIFFFTPVLFCWCVNRFGHAHVLGYRQ